MHDYVDFSMSHGICTDMYAIWLRGFCQVCYEYGNAHLPIDGSRLMRSQRWMLQDIARRHDRKAGEV